MDATQFVSRLKCSLLIDTSTIYRDWFCSISFLLPLRALIDSNRLPTNCSMACSPVGDVESESLELIFFLSL